MKLRWKAATHCEESDVLETNILLVERNAG